MKLDYHLIKSPLNNDVYCGDTGIVKVFDDKVFFGVIDVLGHGKEAHDLAKICVEFLAVNLHLELAGMMEALHQQLRGSRGAVASLCRLDPDKEILSYVSVGDTLVRKLNNDKSRIFSNQGIIGYQLGSLKERTMPMNDGDILLLHTDGLPSHFDPWEDDILKGDARTIAGTLIARFCKKHDDALCIVLRYGK